MPTTASRKTGSFSRPRLEPILGGTSALVSFTFTKATDTKARAMSAQNWVEATPPGFVFAVKANQRITHILRLKNAAEATALFLKMIDPLRSARRLGPILFQLPPHLKCDE